MYQRVAIIRPKPSIPVIRYLVKNKIAMANIKGKCNYKEINQLVKLGQKIKAGTVVIPQINNFNQLQLTKDLGFLHVFTFDFSNSYQLNNQKLVFDAIIRDRFSINYTTVDDKNLLNWIETWVKHN